jgi:hypothetical protein
MALPDNVLKSLGESVPFPKRLGHRTNTRTWPRP